MSRSPFRILMVCTGNIGRSPMMERLMVHRLRELGAGEWMSVTSAGTVARFGAGMEPFAAQVLQERGLSATGFGATPLTAELVSAADLVLTATREHRSRVVNLAPSAVRRAFTVLELQRVAHDSGAAPVERSLGVPESDVDLATSAVAWAAQMRGAVARPADEADDDLPDPLGESIDVYRTRAEAISAAVEQIVPFLLGLQGDSAAG